MCRKMIMWLSVLSTLAVIGHAIGAQSITGTLEVGSSGSTIITVLGCMERFFCQGTGTDINWRFFGTRIDITNTSSRHITITRDEATRKVSSHLTFTEVMQDHGDTYTCNIIDAVARRTITLSARLTVNNTRVYVEPIQNIDISNNTIGDNISIGCSIQTCEEEVTVSIMKGTQEIHRTTIANQNNALVNRDLVVSGSTADIYECRVMIQDRGETFSQRFNITGTPQRPTTAPPSSMSPTDGMGNTPSRPTSRNGATSLFGIHLPLLCLLALLSLFTNARL